MIIVKSLQQRHSLFMLLPVTILLFVMGLVVFRYAREMLLNQWSETVVVKLSVAAHQVDMRLGKTKEVLGYINDSVKGGDLPRVNHFLLEELRKLDGVMRVEVEIPGLEDGMGMGMGRRNTIAGQERIQQGMQRWMMSPEVELTPPRVDIESGNKMVNLVLDLGDDKQENRGTVTVAVSFDYLIENIVSADWWQEYQAFLVDDSGMILASTNDQKQVFFGNREHLDDQGVLDRMKAQHSGTILGPGKPPSIVTGFYRLKQAPWTLIVEAPGEEVLSPIITFRQFYFLIMAGFVVLVLLVMRVVTGRTSTRIKAVARAADLLAQGRFSKLVPAKTYDEVGDLTRSFNTMMKQLEERAELKKALNLAMEVQRSLLPKTSPQLKGVDLAGRSVYCDETGGDYFDFLTNPHYPGDTVTFLVGDVAGHGVSSALLMATVRGFLRQRTSSGGTISEIIRDVNCQLSEDVEESGQFMTAYCGLLDVPHRRFAWVTAGHDPAIVYDSQSDEFDDWGGKGAALGLTECSEYQEDSRELRPGQIIVVGTDGIWETRNQAGEFFGKDRLRHLIREQRDQSADAIIDAVLADVEAFRRPQKPKDDITLVVIKVEELPDA